MDEPSFRKLTRCRSGNFTQKNATIMAHILAEGRESQTEHKTSCIAIEQNRYGAPKREYSGVAQLFLSPFTVLCNGRARSLWHRCASSGKGIFRVGRVVKLRGDRRLTGQTNQSNKGHGCGNVKPCVVIHFISTALGNGNPPFHQSINPCALPCALLLLRRNQKGHLKGWKSACLRMFFLSDNFFRSFSTMGHILTPSLPFC